MTTLRTHPKFRWLLCGLLGSSQVLAQSPEETEGAKTDALAAAASPDQLDRQAAGLIADVTRLVAAETSVGWVVDDLEIDDMLPALLRSVCRAVPAARQMALARLEAKSRTEGDPKGLYLAAGHEMTDRVKDALAAQRRLRALEAALAVADRSCPFWLELDPEFEGQQTDRNRFTLNVESGGVAILRQTAGGWTLGAGGFGRVLPSYGFDGDWTLLGGVEFGGGALLRPGEQTTGVAVNYFPALPVIARIRGTSWHYDIEVAPVALFQTDDTRVSYGARFGTTIGLSALYTTGFIPWAGASLAYEYYFSSGGRPEAHFIRSGFRAGISWDP